MTAPEFADDLDADMFRIINRLRRLHEMTGDKMLLAAESTVASQRQYVRKHMTETMRERAPN